MYLIPFKSDHAKIMMSQGTNAAQIGMDPDHSEKMRAAGLSHGDRLDDGIYPRLPQIQPSAPF